MRLTKHHHLFPRPPTQPKSNKAKTPHSQDPPPTNSHRPQTPSISLLPSSMAIPTPTRPKTLTLILSLIFLSLLLLLSFSPSLPSPKPPKSSSFDLRSISSSWNSLPFPPSPPPHPPLKLAVFSRNWPSSSSSPGGMERHALTLHSSLSLRGHQIHIFTSAIIASHPLPNLHFHTLSSPRWNCDEAFSLFQTQNALSPFDAIHSESVSLLHRYARLLPNLAVSWHGISLESLLSSIYQSLLSPPSPSTPSLPSPLPKLLAEIRFFPSYHHHVAISHSMADILRDVYQLPLPRVHVILNGVDDSVFYPDQSPTNFNLPKDAEFVMGVAGRLVKDKGHPLLHEAFREIVRRHPKVYLVVAGSGPWEQRYRELGGNVVVVGELTPGELRGFYNAIDVFVNPTLRPQGLDLTLMEAMQCGTAVMGTRFASIKGSVVVRDELGILFSPNVAALGEAMERAIGEGRGGMERRGRACREYAREMFTARKMALAYERLFLCIRNESFCRYPLASV